MFYNINIPNKECECGSDHVTSVCEYPATLQCNDCMLIVCERCKEHDCAFQDSGDNEVKKFSVDKDFNINSFNDPDFDRVINKCRELVATKGKDYTGNNDDKLANFKEAAKFLGISPRQSLGLYFYKHISAIFKYIKFGQVDSEPIELRICDAINYLLHLAKMAREEGQNNHGVFK